MFLRLDTIATEMASWVNGFDFSALLTQTLLKFAPQLPPAVKKLEATLVNHDAIMLARIITRVQGLCHPREEKQQQQLNIGIKKFLCE